MKEFVISSVIEREARCCMHLLAPRWSASSQAHAHRGKLDSQQGSSKPCRMACVPECEDGYDWPSPCSHSRQSYSRHPFRLSSALGQVAEGKLAHRTRQLGFKEICGSHSCTTPMHFSIHVLKASSFKWLYMLCSSPFSVHTPQCVLLR